jgi:hypothetical protein
VVTDVVALLLLVTRILDERGIPYVVGGSLASSQYGELRATNDVDLMIDLPLERVGALVAAMKDRFDIWEDTVRAAVLAGRSFGTLHVDWHVKVDFFPMGAAMLDVKTMERREAVRFSAEPTRDVFYASAEDVILRKLLWHRKSGGVLERQVRDVLGILKVQGTRLDFDYLRSMATELDLSPVLEGCIDEAGLARR